MMVTRLPLREKYNQSPILYHVIHDECLYSYIINIGLTILSSVLSRCFSNQPLHLTYVGLTSIGSDITSQLIKDSES